MEFATHVSHYFEKDYGPWLNICNLDSEQRRQVIEREKTAQTGFNRFSFGEEFFDFRLLADDLLMEAYTSKFGKAPARRPFYGVLGDADVVGGLYREPCKIQLPLDAFGPEELTIMCPDHFHLVSFMGRGGGKRMFGYQLPKDYSSAAHPYFGKLLTYEELKRDARPLKIDRYLESQKQINHWYRYLEVQIWLDPEALKRSHPDWVDVVPEPWSDGKVTHLQNEKPSHK